MTSSIRLLSFVVMTSVVSGNRVTSGRYVTVTTKYGLARGFRTDVDGNTAVDTFLGLPYAQPPVGTLRFRPTQPLKSWRGVRDATKRGVPRCPHTGSELPESEDCLYLNVYTPRLSQAPSSRSSQAPRPRFPVFVFVHGGSYLFGTGSTYDGTMLSAQGVVVVTINYRLGALGWLSTEDDAAMGNYGAYDVIQALEWVRDAIAAFDGDANSVTLAGHSAGSAMVSLFLTCQRARGLFHKVIMHSGVSVAQFAVALFGTHLEPRPVEYAEQLGRDLDCDVSDHVAMVDCLRQKKVSDIIEKADSAIYVAGRPGPIIAYRPTVATRREDSLFTLLPEVAFTANQSFAQVPTIRGYTNFDWGDDCSNEGLVNARAKYMFSDKFMKEMFFMLQPALNGTFHNTTALLLPYLGQKATRELSQVLNESGGHLNDRLEMCLAGGKMWTDLLFGAPAVKELELSSSVTQQPQYLYVFSHAEHRNHQSFHGDDTAFVFGFPHRYNSSWGKYMEFAKFPKQWSDTDRQLSSLVMTMWVNFMKYGNPTPQPLSWQGGRAEWLPWKQATPRYLEIGMNTSLREGPEIPAVVYPYPLSKAMLYNRGGAVTVQSCSLLFAFLALLCKG